MRVTVMLANYSLGFQGRSCIMFW